MKERRSYVFWSERRHFDQSIRRVLLAVDKYRRRFWHQFQTRFWRGISQGYVCFGGRPALSAFSLNNVRSSPPFRRMRRKGFRVLVVVVM
jgi:hypothetical protein